MGADPLLVALVRGLFGEMAEAPPPPPRKGHVREFRVLYHPVADTDKTIRVCPVCHSELTWRYREGVIWDRGLPVCPTHGLLHSWRVLSRDGKRLLAFARVDNKGRVLKKARDLESMPGRPARVLNARHHHKNLTTAQRRLVNIEAHDTAEVGPAAWASRLGPAKEVTE